MAESQNQVPSSFRNPIGYLPTTRSSESTYQHPFEIDLSTTRVYTRTRLYNTDESFTTSAIRTHVWSVLSGLSLSEVSNISVIALPLYLSELKSGHWCGFETSRRKSMSETRLHPQPLDSGPEHSTEPDSKTTSLVQKTREQWQCRHSIIHEFVKTEKEYVQDLAQLHELKFILEQREVLSAIKIQEIFYNIDTIHGFCQNLLNEIEESSGLHPMDEQIWGTLFAKQEENFNVYIPLHGKASKGISGSSARVRQNLADRSSADCGCEHIDNLSVQTIKQAFQIPRIP